ncbi:UEV domain-containing protein [Cryomyces antarcticus]
MATVPDKVLNWLYSVLTSEYHDPDRTYSDVAQALSQYPSLSPRTEVYTHETGTSALLLVLKGTLPASFRGTIYRFPIQLWVPHAYPREGPMIYVTPSKESTAKDRAAQEMVVRPGQHVSADGRVYHPYLANWARAWDRSTISDFLAILRDVFGKEPPVIAKPPQYGEYRPPQWTSQPTPPPVPPPPGALRRAVQLGPAQSPRQAPEPPPKPPKPGEEPTNAGMQGDAQRYLADSGPPLPPLPLGARSSMHGPADHRNQAASTQVQVRGQDGSIRPGSLRNGDGPPLPPLSARPQTHFQPQAQHHGGGPVSPLSPNGQRQGSYSNLQQPPLPHPPYPDQGQRLPPQPPHPQGPPQQYHHASSNQQHYPPNRQQASHPTQPHAPTQIPKPPKPAQDLLSGPFDVTLPSQLQTGLPPPAPPVPRNPEKDALLSALSSTLRSQLQQTLQQNATAVSSLRAQHHALQDAHSRLSAELAQLQQLDALLASNEQILHASMQDADRVIADARHRSLPPIDDVLVAPTVVGGQLWTLVAEERGIGEALWCLGRAMSEGRVSGEVFVKLTRSLAREQFLKKALIRKISRGMGLDEGAAV